MTLELLDLQRMQYVKLDSGKLADSLSVHELRRAMAKEGHKVFPDDGKQTLIQRLFEHREAQEKDARKLAPADARPKA